MCPYVRTVTIKTLLTFSSSTLDLLLCWDTKIYEINIIILLKCFTSNLYIDELNKAISGSEFETATLAEIIRDAAGKPSHLSIFNNAAQAWNHAFYWHSLNRDGGGDPPPDLKHMIETSFDSVDVCKKELATAAISQFGSGWAWLVQDDKKLRVIKTNDGDNPITQGLNPLLTIDVWEHAYYLDFQNRRKDYVDAVIDKLINWNFAAANIL